MQSNETTTRPTLEELKAQPHYSYSALNTYLNICGLQYRYRYVDRLEPEQTPVALPFGSAFHAALSEQAQAARKGELIPVGQLTDAFATYLKTGLDASTNVLYKDGQNADDLIAQAGKMLEAATSEWPDYFGIIAGVAVPFTVAIDGLSKPLIGEYDLLLKEPTPFDDREAGPSVTIVDWKSSARMWPEDRADRELQAAVYIGAYEATHGQRPDFRYDIVTKAAKPRVARYYTARSDSQIARMKSLVLAADKAINAGVFLPNETSFACADCPFAGTCRGWSCHTNHASRKEAA